MSKRQWAWVIPILAALVGTISYKLAVWGRLEQTSLLFIGIPGTIAMVCVLTPEPKSATGTAVKAVTLFIGVAGIFLGEGFICLLMAAPLFYLVAIIVGLIRDRARRQSTVVSCLLVIAMVPISSEGVRPGLSFDREETVVAERVVAAAPEQIKSALNSEPRLNGRFPFYLQLGFPRPVAISHQGSGVGSRETIHFAGGEGRPGDLILEVTYATDQQMRLRAISDTSHVAHWVQWQESQVQWSAVDSTHTRVQWTLRYRRLLDPAWYFAPWERYAAHLAADQLIQDAATPR